ncbi:putative 2OG-Fe(II) oxygenase [Sphingomonas sp. AOB5]|uniref:2OG-Fe(II) oxygenase family protein n=1 Tax=Sphingomonas sp. AOB5 TaxID=3034017 RepID=UPI0023F8C951|nr:putative 2OG-Fe(II) oxygenase [Sphingomonas sp. AOB5]MDF7775092.1 putative 2OG-Fe(II) oxygenase [Sphingomonas sp. AOB5]
MTAGTAAGLDAMLAALKAPSPRADLAAATGLRALQERREADAIPLLAGIAAQRGNDAQLWHILGLLHRATGDMAPAIAALDRALAITPNEPRLIHARARTALEGGQGGIEWFARARAADPNNGDVILGEASALLDSGDVMRADATLAAMLAQHPGWIPGHAAIARLRFADGERQRFTATIDTALEGAPGDLRLHHLKIVVLLRASLFDEAAHALAQAQRVLGDVPALRALTAMLATERGQLDAADAAFATLDPWSDGDLAVHLLRHLLRRGRAAEVAALADRLPDAIRPLAWPYLSLAWRLMDDPRAAWLDDPRLIHVVDLGEDLPLLEPLAARLRALHHARHQPADQSVRGGTQTDGPLLSRIDPELATIRAALKGAVADYIAKLPPPDPRHPLLGRIPRHPRFIGSWSVRLQGQGFHDPHVHTEGWLSSAFYVDLPDSMRGASEGDGSGWLTLGAPQASLGTGLEAMKLVEPKPGRLVLFPSTLWHGTLPFSEGERLTIAFDIG